MKRLLIAALTLALATPAPASAAFELRPGDILVAGITRGGNGGIFRVDPDSGRQTLVSLGALLFSPSDLELAPDGRILVMDPGSLFGGSIVAVDPDKPGGPTTNQTLVSNHQISGPDLFEAPLGLTVSPEGRIFVADADIPGSSPSTATAGQRLIAANNNLASPVAIDLAPGPRLFVADSLGSRAATARSSRSTPPTGSRASSPPG